MVEIKRTWAQIKTLVDTRYLNLQYDEYDEAYELWAPEDVVIYVCTIDKSDPANDDQTDFENNYKSNSNKELVVKNSQGKPTLIASSRPKDMMTVFTTRADDIENNLIAKGPKFEWDFSNSDNEVTAPTGFKRKRIEGFWIDEFWIKEGTTYHYNGAKGSYVDFYIVCPAGQYYYKNDGTPALASEDIVVVHYVVEQPLQGDAPMGDEVNTEEASETPIPPNYKMRMEVTTPDTDTTSNGSLMIELYRYRTVIL